MGSHHKIYVGPYIRCENKPTDVEITRGVACPLPSCFSTVLDDKAKFCPTCGTGVIPRKAVVKRRPVDEHEVYEKLRDRMHAFGAHNDEGFETFDAWVSNVAWHGQPSRDVDDLVGESRIKDSDPPTERVLFEMAFKDEIAHIRKAYGDKNVEVRWGVLGTWS